MKISGSVLFFVLLVLIGCGGGTSTKSAGGPLSGNWQMTLQPIRVRTTQSQSGFLLQTNNSLSGSFVSSDRCAGANPVSGTLSNSAVSLSVNQFGAALTLTGSASADNSSMSGSYSITAGGCGNPDTGTWTAVQVKPVQGSFHGTLTPSQNSPLSGNTYQVTGTLAQGPNTGSSNTDLVGSMFVTNYPCFSSVTVRGTISGQNVLLSLYTLDGTNIAMIPSPGSGSFATLSADATSLSDPASSGYGALTCPGLGPNAAQGDSGAIELTFP